MDVSKVRDLLENFRHPSNPWVTGWDFWHEVPEQEWPEQEWFVVSLGLDATTVSKSGGAYEDINPHVGVIVKIDGLDQDARFFRMSGYYSSYDGTVWDGDFEEVIPYEVPTVAYRKL